jgi:cytochrome c2
MLAGCVGIESVAPVVGPEMVRVASVGTGINTLQQGRTLLANRCTSCHSLEPIAKYTPSELGRDRS